jgi:DNA-binding Lrp family transcriptional regulator
MTYQSLSGKLDLSVNAIKKRVEKLESDGIILKFVIYPSLAMLDAEMMLGILTLDNKPHGDELLDYLGSNNMIFGTSYLFNRDILIFGEYIGAMGLAEIRKFLKQTDGVQDIELHTLLLERGSQCDLSDQDLIVLRELYDDPRIPISEIAKRTNLTPRRVRKILNRFLGEGGSKPEYAIQKASIGDDRTSQACFHFRLNWNLNAGGKTAYINLIRWDEGKGDMGIIVNWIKKLYPDEFWYAYASATESVIFAVFLVDHFREAEEIAKQLLEGPNVNFVRPLFGYPTKTFPGLRETWLKTTLNL